MGVVSMSDCILWEGHKDRDGYGRQTFKRKDYRVHRLAYERAHGPIPEGLVVRHKCDNRACYNVAHLELGSPADNSSDMVERGRSLSGEKHSLAKLTEDSVRYIRKSTLSCSVLAAELNVSKAAVAKARSGETWRHVNG
ncbi:MAG: HNH endonuclease signature motif containing protein [Plesiomonas sp.]